MDIEEAIVVVKEARRSLGTCAGVFEREAWSAMYAGDLLDAAETLLAKVREDGRTGQCQCQGPVCYCRQHTGQRQGTERGEL
jgi:hypothetical protein